MYGSKWNRARGAAGGGRRRAARRSDRGKGTGYVIRFSKSEYTARTCLHNNVLRPIHLGTQYPHYFSNLFLNMI